MQLYKEINADTGEPLKPDEQANPHIMLKILQTKMVKASKEEVKTAKIQFKTNGKCAVHLCHDVPGFIYDSRECGICGKWLAYI